jgi:hypothetical protein
MNSARSYRQMKVLITGASGFLGGHLVERLASAGPVFFEIRKTDGGVRLRCRRGDRRTRRRPHHRVLPLERLRRRRSKSQATARPNSRTTAPSRLRCRSITATTPSSRAAASDFFNSLLVLRRRQTIQRFSLAAENSMRMSVLPLQVLSAPIESVH